MIQRLGSALVKHGEYTLKEYLDNVASCYVNVLDFIPKSKHAALSDLGTALAQGDIGQHIQACLDYCEANHKDVVFPFGYYCTKQTLMLPARCKVQGAGLPYIIALPGFVGTSAVSCDKTGQPEYYMDGFYINNDAANTNLEGLRIGGCRNSKFSFLVLTSFKSIAVNVAPTHPNSGDVDNFHLDHIWTVLGGQIRLDANGAISRGNITDGKIENCMLMCGDANAASPYAILLRSAPGRIIFGVEFNRVFTMVTDNNHMVIIPNGGTISGNSFSNFSGESWVVGSGISPTYNKVGVYVFDGEFINNSFRHFYSTGLPGSGIQLGVGSSGNLFEGLTFVDNNVHGVNNKWLHIPKGATGNMFYGVRTTNILLAGSPLDAVTATTLFGAAAPKITDLDGGTKFSGSYIEQTVPTLVKRSHIFELDGIQLKNYPVVGCAFQSAASGLIVTVPAGSTPYYLTIPFKRPAGLRGGYISGALRYVMGEDVGLKLSMHICGKGRPGTDFTKNVTNSICFTAPYDAANETVVITFSGNRTADASFGLEDIVIADGCNIPYLPSFHKVYVES